MDINALSAQFLNSPYVPFSSSMPGASLPSAQGLNNNNDFAELLRRTQNPAAAGDSAADTGLHRPSGLPAYVRDEKLYEACVELETFLIKNMIKSMRSTVQKTNLIDTGMAGEIYEDMLYDEYAKTYARNAGLGFAEMAYKELSGTLHSSRY